MQFMLNAVKLYERLTTSLVVGWLFALLFIVVLFYACRNIIALALLKLHEVFIQRDYFRLSGKIKNA